MVFAALRADDDDALVSTRVKDRTHRLEILEILEDRLSLFWIDVGHFADGNAPTPAPAVRAPEAPEDGRGLEGAPGIANQGDFSGAREYHLVRKTVIRPPSWAAIQAGASVPEGEPFPIMSPQRSQSQGGAIPRWISIANLLAIVVALAIVVPRQVHAAIAQAPTNLCLCVRLSPTAPKLSWSDTANGAALTGYILQRSSTSDFSAGVTELPITRNTFDFIDETLRFSTTFWYRVIAVDGTDRSAPSNVVVAGNGTGTAPSAPARPTNVRVARGNGGLQITWTNNASNETGVWVERSSDAGTQWQYRASLSLNSTSYLDTDPPNGAPSYRIWTFNSGGLSPSETFLFADAAVQTPNTNSLVPSINTNSLVPTINTSNLTSIVPSINTSNLTSIVPSINTNSLIPTINTQSLIPSINVNSLIPTVNTQSLLSLVPSVNPTQFIPPIPNPKIWIGLHNKGDNSYVGVWLAPANCALGQSGLCGVPLKTVMQCTPNNVLLYENCSWVDTSPGTYP